MKDAEQAVLEQIAELYRLGFTEARLINPRTMETKELFISVANGTVIVLVHGAAA